MIEKMVANRRESLSPCSGVMVWSIPIGAALIVVLGALLVFWRRFEPRRD